MLKALEQFLETIVYGFAVLVSVGVAWSVLLCLVRAGVCRLAYLARQGAVLSILFGSMAIVGIVTGFAKTNGTDRVGAPRRIELCPTDSHLVGGIGSDDIAWGWRVVSVCSNALEASIFAMPTNAVVWDGALRHGAGHGSWRLPAGWRFPFNGPVWTNGFLWVEGVFRSRFDNRSDEIRILDERLTLCPAANWARYSLDASRAWCLVNDNGSLVATFENAALGDDPARIVSAQLELRSAQGEIALRYDLHTIGDDIRAVGPVLGGTFLSFAVTSNTSEVVFRRVHLDDWDWDGLPNEIDDQPYVPCAEPAWGQSDEWAACAFPDNVAEITAAGGYHAWVTARAAEPDRHLVGLEISSPDNVWPIRVSFGDLQVMCDSTNRLYFAIDDGAKYTFELSDGVLSSVTIGNEDRVGSLWEDWYHPWDWCFWPTMVTAHMDSAKAGWIGRLPSVTVDGLEGTHFYPNDSKQVSVVVTDCHADSVRDYRWSGGADFTFSNPTSRTTMVTWGGGHAWATNVVRVVTTYEGGLAVTNDHTVTVGMQPEPDTTFSVSCQKVFFLNDAEILADGSWTNNRPERIRPIRVDMRAARGTQGTLAITATGAAQPMLFRVDENGVTNIVPSGARIPLGIESGSLTRETTADGCWG